MLFQTPRIIARHLDTADVDDLQRVIGFCGIVHPGGQPAPEIKYALKRNCWGQGFATEAVRAMLDYGVREFHLSRIMATVAPENSASMAVLRKVGMEPARDRKEADGTVTRVFLWRPEPSPA